MSATLARVEVSEALGGVTAPRSFVASGINCGIRRSRPDLAVVRSTARATGAGMFTVNRMQAAPVVVSREHLSLADPQVVVVNSGVANAATGPAGERDARTTAACAAGLLRLAPKEIVVLSTGVIGAPLPLPRVLTGLAGAVRELSADGGARAAEAILTTDTCTKEAVALGDGFAVGGMAKGSGMIHPNLATMLAVLTTDYPLDSGEPIEFLRPAVDASFNSISVDGECSTNDAVILLANGASGIRRTATSDAEFALALGRVCDDLARQIVADGEGVTLVAEIHVDGAESEPQAKAIARRVATSSLVKTALFGRDANWGRIVAAAGSAPYNGGFASLDPARISLRLNGVPLLVAGAPQSGEPELGGDACRIELDLGLGDGRASYLTSDLSYEYVRINAEYRT
jgi:glutamate N-acetyltransferase/amino-acid N-acetyltransferase